MNILDYIDINLSWKKNKPKFKFVIKKEKRIKALHQMVR